MAKIIKMKDLLKKEGFDLGRIYTDKDRPPFKINESPKEDLNYLYSRDKKQLEKEFEDIDHYLKAMAKDLGKAGYKKQSVEFQRFYKKHWIEFKLKFEKLYKNVIGRR